MRAKLQAKSFFHLFSCNLCSLKNTFQRSSGTLLQVDATGHAVEAVNFVHAVWVVFPLIFTSCELGRTDNRESDFGIVSRVSAEQFHLLKSNKL